MKQKIIVGTSAILLISLFVCAFAFLSDRERTADGFIEESITTVPIEEAVTINNDSVTDGVPASHEFRMGAPEDISTLPITSDGMIEESITVVPVEDASEDASFPAHDFHFETP